MVTLDHARNLALALPETVEQPHYDMPAFRVRGRIFATVPDEQHLRVRVDENEIRAYCAEYPEACREFWWGTRLACLLLSLPAADTGLVRELLAEAWLNKAPRTVARTVDLGSA